MSTMTATTTQVYQLFIKATPEQIWDAITNPEITPKYFFASRVEIADGRRRAFGPDGSVWGDEEILEEDPPRRLVHGWSGLYDPELAEEESEPRDVGDRAAGRRLHEADPGPRPARGRAEDGRARRGRAG